MEFHDYLIHTGKEQRVVSLKTGDILDIRVNEYGHCSVLDTTSGENYEVITEDNYRMFPFVSQYINFPENKALVRIFLEELSVLRNNLRNV